MTTANQPSLSPAASSRGAEGPSSFRRSASPPEGRVLVSSDAGPLASSFFVSPDAEPPVSPAPVVAGRTPAVADPQTRLSEEAASHAAGPAE